MHVNKILVSALLCVALTAPALGQNLRLTKKQLRQENARLRMQMDSLRIDLEKYRSDSRLNDSIVSELRDIYENNAQRSAAGLNPFTPPDRAQQRRPGIRHGFGPLRIQRTGQGLY